MTKQSKAKARSKAKPAPGKKSARKGRAEAGSRKAVPRKPQAPAISFTGNTVMEGGRRLLAIAPGLENFVGSTPALTEATERLSENVTVTVAPQNVVKERIQEQRGRLRERNIDDFKPRPDSMGIAVERLKQLGFSVQREGRFTITASGPARLVSDVLNVQLALQTRPQRGPFRATQNFSASYAEPRPDDLYVAPTESLTVRSTVSEHIDDFIFIPPPLLFAPSAAAPAYQWHGLNEAEIRQLLSVPAGVAGQDVKIGIVDTGFFLHPYYAANNLAYKPTPTPSAPQPEVDSNGHGTAIAFNVFAVAPKAMVLGFGRTNPPQDALEDAADAGVDIISCSWGWEGEQSFPNLELTIRDIAREGKIMLFASGNGQRAWPGSMPEVISIGGVFADPGNALEASNYSSGFTSDLYPNRKVPDVCGLVGQKPAAVYIMMPCPPGSFMDKQFGKPFPNGDGTPKNDGWVGASGTSSATPQIAGVAALLVERARAKGLALTNDDLRDLLQSTAKPVQKGNNAQGFPAVGHPNVAVGHGLVDAAAALAKL